MALHQEQVEIEIKEKNYVACVTTSEAFTPECGVILTHGAGGDMNNKQLVLFSEHLARAGFLVLRFTCKGLNLIHRSNIYLQVLKYLHGSEYGIKECFLAGRSMGSRAAVEVANKIVSESDHDLDSFVKGVICISYPLYPPKNKDKLRDGPIKDCKKPILFISGTKDEMCNQELLIDTMKDNVNVDCLWISGAAHSLEAKDLKIEETVHECSENISSWSKSIKHKTDGKPKAISSKDNGDAKNSVSKTLGKRKVKSSKTVAKKTK